MPAICLRDFRQICAPLGKGRQPGSEPDGLVADDLNDRRVKTDHEGDTEGYDGCVTVLF
jgi:hypothetical protein